MNFREELTYEELEQIQHELVWYLVTQALRVEKSWEGNVCSKATVAFDGVGDDSKYNVDFTLRRFKKHSRLEVDLKYTMKIDDFGTE